MADIIVTVTRNEHVASDIAQRIANEFLEWLEREGVDLTFPPHHSDHDYEQMAELYIHHVIADRNGRIR